MNLISCEKLEKSMVELQFSIDAETFKSAVNTAFKREGKKYAIPGFRKGKAPKAMIEKMYGKDLFQYDAINDLFPENYEAAVKEAGIEVEPIHVALWGIPTAISAFAIHAFRLHRLDKQLAREIAAEKKSAQGEQA